MEYFSGLFDAEGYVSMSAEGRFTVGTELTHEPSVLLLKQAFGGNIYTRQRKDRKRTYSWCIAGNRDLTLAFIEKVIPNSVIKRTQLNHLRDYLEETREARRDCRPIVRSTIASLKKPLPLTKEHINVPTENPINESFIKWLAGFFDGDGSFCIYEYKGKKTQIFDSWVSVFNIHGDAIAFVKSHVDGSISQYKQSKNPVWKWVCSEKYSIALCESLIPFLKIKKEQANIVLEFLKMKKTREQSYSYDQVNKIRDMILQIKHLNSL